MSSRRHNISPQTNKQETKGKAAGLPILRSPGAQVMLYGVIDIKRSEVHLLLTPLYSLWGIGIPPSVPTLCYYL